MLFSWCGSVSALTLFAVQFWVVASDSQAGGCHKQLSIDFTALAMASSQAVLAAMILAPVWQGSLPSALQKSVFLQSLASLGRALWADQYH